MMKDIPGLEGKYAITEDGRVWSYNKNKYMKQYKDEQDYLYVDLRIDGKVKHRKVHRLVALTYIPNPENKPEVDHIDENKDNCFVTNLRWATSKENKANSPQTGKKKSRTKVRCKETGEVFKSMVQAAEFAGIHRYSINLCLLGKQETAGGYHWERVEKN